jgi:hypothetical protein
MRISNAIPKYHQRKTHLLIDNIQRRLINQPHIQPQLPTPQHRIPRTIQHLSKRHHIPRLALRNNLVFPRYELVPVLEEPGAILLEDPGHLGACGEDEAYAALEEDTLDNGDHLGRVGGEVEEGVHVREAVVGEHGVDTEMAGVVGLVRYQSVD